MSKNYSEQELRNTISDNIKSIAEYTTTKRIQDVTVEDVRDYFTANVDNADADADALAEDAEVALSHYAHIPENSNAQIERILEDVKQYH